MTSQSPEIPAYGGCPWPVDPACETEEWLTLDPEVRERSLALASATLHRLSGYRVGGCPITVRPGPQIASCGPVGRYEYGSMFGIGRIGLPKGRDPRRIRLAGPIGRIDMVRIGIDILDPSEYRVEGNDLVRLGADAAWPQNPDMYSPLGSPNTWSITYLNAYPVDAAAAYAVGLLALEFSRACTSGKKCGLPSSVVSIVRQGVSMDITPGAFPGGFTGIRMIDTWIGLWNPGGLRAPSRVFSPDIDRMIVVEAPVL